MALTLLCLVWIGIVACAYRWQTARLVLRIPGLIVAALLVTVPVAYGMYGRAQDAPPWRDEIALILLLTLAVAVATRRGASGQGLAPLLTRRVLVLGTGAEAAEVGNSLVLSGRHVRIAGFYPVRPQRDSQVNREMVLADDESLAAAARRLKVHEIVVAVRDRRGDAVPVADLLDCKLAGIRVLGLSSYFEQALGQVHLDSLHASWLIFGEGFRQDLLRRTVKRLFDLGAAVVLLGLLWPVMVIGAILILLDSGFPIFYQQERVGLGGRLFRVVKFRSMRIDAESDGQPRWATGNDQRVTRVGRILRRLRIDELPQLYNVLKGDMSLCGPRPERPHFVAQLAGEIPFYAARHSIKPGITGWAQVRYRYGESVADAQQKLQYDLYYVKNHTLLLDTEILLRTVRVVVTGAGAH